MAYPAATSLSPMVCVCDSPMTVVDISACGQSLLVNSSLVKVPYGDTESAGLHEEISTFVCNHLATKFL